MQLSARALLKPFTSAASSNEDDNTDDSDDVAAPDSEDAGLDENDGDEEDGTTEEEESDQEDEEDTFEGLEDEAQEALLENTFAVRMTLKKVRSPFLMNNACAEN